MSRQGEAFEILNKAKDINKKDVKSYLEMRKSLSENIRLLFEKLQAHALGVPYQDKEVTKDEATNIKWLIKFYIDELKDPDGVFADIIAEAEEKLEAAGKKRNDVTQDVPSLGNPVVSFSKTAE